MTRGDGDKPGWIRLGEGPEFYQLGSGGTVLCQFDEGLVNGDQVVGSLGSQGGFISNLVAVPEPATFSCSPRERRRCALADARKSRKLIRACDMPKLDPFF